MRTLYVSDLDGTLLRSDERTSDYTNQTINRLVEKGMLFSYATARSYQTSHKVTKGLNARIPLITYNGAMIVDNVDGTFLAKNFFHDNAADLITDLLDHRVFPIVYSMQDNAEKYSYFSPLSKVGSLVVEIHPGMNFFLKSRSGDKRECPVDNTVDLMKGEVFYITCIDEKSKLEGLYEKYKDIYHCVFQVEIYTQEYWLEIMPRNASKSNAISQLKRYLMCDRLVVFGDGKNDIDMFRIADEAYAVDNAVLELKEIATGIIGSNDADGVAEWLNRNVL